jgi:hypothetical protein
LMNRVLGDYRNRPHVSQIVSAPGLDQLSFSGLTAALSEDLYDGRTGKGNLILFNPGRIQARYRIDTGSMSFRSVIATTPRRQSLSVSTPDQQLCYEWVESEVIVVRKYVEFAFRFH